MQTTLSLTLCCLNAFALLLSHRGSAAFFLFNGCWNVHACCCVKLRDLNGMQCLSNSAWLWPMVDYCILYRFIGWFLLYATLSGSSGIELSKEVCRLLWLLSGELCVMTSSAQCLPKLFNHDDRLLSGIQTLASL